ncbi:hypothetical protein J1N10_18030 [Carboxylicivirga sp. A043]|uniref:hypothetical protein n=1 Tax=Carboxylicivirga litoralis TaxID=2816963 RepID=UPI0021CB2C92|nr:hypothetical protein [Carboxylicivirga sp. A043]MCU4157878.1 hypothetical protein [Carboxylicivirga sp. A043]
MKYIHKAYILTFLVLVASIFTLKAQEKKEIDILFIGNSFTARHDLSELVKQVFEEGKPNLTVNVEKVIYGGQSLFQHHEYYYSQTFIEQNTIQDETIQNRIAEMQNLLELNELPDEFVDFWQDIRKKKARDFPKNLIEIAIKRHDALLNKKVRRKWDYVVLQSWMDEIPDLNDGYAKYARKMSRIAKEEGAEVILYITAPDIQNKESVSSPINQENVDQEISFVIDLAKELKPYAVVHVPLAINMIQQGGTDLTFCYINDFHPNQRTAFLTANMFYAAFFKECTERFRFNTVTETKTHTNDQNPEAKLDPDGNPATVVFEKEEKNYLQSMAYKAAVKFVQQWKKQSN